MLVVFGCDLSREVLQWSFESRNFYCFQSNGHALGVSLVIEIRGKFHYRLSSIIRNIKMEISDDILLNNRDWDPSYLCDIVEVDFNDMSELWGADVVDMDLVRECDQIERYCPITGY